LVGLAVAQSATLWNNVIDAAKGDAQTKGILAEALFSYNGTTFDRLRGTIANGILVDVTRVTGNVSVIGTQSDNSTNSTAKLPTIPCRANASAPSWTEGNQVPCSTDLAGGMRIAGGGSSSSVQGATLFNAQASSGSNTALVVTIAAAASTRAHLYKLQVLCVGGGTTSATVTDGATVISSMSAPQNGMVNTETWPVGLTGTTNTNMVLTLNACGTGGTGVMTYQADRF
jgi:hypothetical protein